LPEKVRIVTKRKIMLSFGLGMILVMLTGFLSSHSPVGAPIPLPGGEVWNYGYPLPWYRTPMGIPGVTIEVPVHPLLGSKGYVLVLNLALDFLFWSCASFALTGFGAYFLAQYVHARQHLHNP